MSDSTRNLVLVALLVFAGGVCCCGGALVALVELGSQEEATWSPFEPVCDGAAIASAPRYERTPGLHRVAVVTRQWDGSWLHDAFWVPMAWEADTVEQAELAICIEDEETAPIPGCPPGARWQPVRVIAAHTAEVLGDVRVCGTATSGPDTETMRRALEPWVTGR